MKSHHLTFLSIFIISVFLPGTLYAIEAHSIAVNEKQDIEFSIEVPPNNTGDTVLLVFPSEYGIQNAERKLLKTLPQQNIEVWISHIFESYFLPASASNLENIPALHIQKIIQKVHNKTHKKIIVLTSGRGAIPVLRALAQWPDKMSPTYFSGLILMHPKLFINTPAPGLVAELMPSVKATNQLIYLIQPKQSPFWWNRNIAIERLQQSGSDVFIHSIKNARNRYYFRADATQQERNLAADYPKLIYRAATQIKLYPVKQRPLISHVATKDTVTSIKTHRRLSKYLGSPIPPSLKLERFRRITLDNSTLSTSQNTYTLHSDTGKVLLVNFWASWCPPCVHEMPSMQKLTHEINAKSKDAFKIIAVNMGEDSKTINEFLNTKVSVDFDILLDSNGTALKQWKIFAFPTSFIIDKKGTIRYAIYGAINWLEADVIEKITMLINE